MVDFLNCRHINSVFSLFSRLLLSLPGPLAGRGGLAEMDADLPQVFTQSGAETPHYGGRHLGFLVSRTDVGVFSPEFLR